MKIQHNNTSKIFNNNLNKNLQKNILSKTAALRALDLSFLTRSARTLRGFVSKIFPTTYLFNLFSRTNPTLLLTPPRIEREFRVISKNEDVKRKLKNERRRAIQEGKRSTKPLSNFAKVVRTTLSHPVHQESTTLSHNGHSIPVSCASMQGKRPTMEDEHIAESFKVKLGQKTLDASVFGIFDGHGGNEASKFVKEHLVQALKKRLEKGSFDDASIFNALKLAFVDLDQQFPGKSGTCASVALVLNGNLWVANVGDSRAVLDNKGKVEQLSRDAKPDRRKCLRRIEKRGGKVIDVQGVPRINGALAVGGAIGDHYLVGKGGFKCISPRPKITKTSLKALKKGSRLIIGCDGLWDVATSKEVVQSKKSAAQIVKGAYAAGSTDNISVMTIDLSHLLSR